MLINIPLIPIPFEYCVINIKVTLKQGKTILGEPHINFL